MTYTEADRKADKRKGAIALVADYLRKRNTDFFNNVKDKLNASIR